MRKPRGRPNKDTTTERLDNHTCNRGKCSLESIANQAIDKAAELLFKTMLATHQLITSSTLLPLTVDGRHGFSKDRTMRLLLLIIHAPLKLPPAAGWPLDLNTD